MTINERLVEARRVLKLTQREFAKKIFVSKGYVASLEAGTRVVNPRIVKLISAVLGINTEWLETGTGEMFYHNTKKEVDEIIELYHQLNPFFKRFFVRQLREIIEYETAKNRGNGNL